MCLGIPGKIIEIYEANGLPMGRIDFGGVTREACLAYVSEAKVGDYAIIHVGFALNLVSEEEAQETLKMFEQIAYTSIQLEGEKPDPELNRGERQNNEVSE